MNTAHDEQQPGEHDQPDIAAARASVDSVAGAIGAKNLKIIIVAMPFVFLAVVGVIIAVFGKPGGAVETGAPAAPQFLDISGAGGGIVLPKNAEIRSVDIEGNQLALNVTTPDGALIIVYDMNQDKIIKTIPVTQVE